MKAFKMVKLPNIEGSTQANIIRVSDKATVLRSPLSLANTKRYLKDLNEMNETGLWLLTKMV